MSRDGLMVAAVLLLLLVAGPLVYWLNTGRRDVVADARAAGAEVGASSDDATCATESYGRASRLRTTSEEESAVVLAFAEGCFAAVTAGEWCAMRCAPDFAVGVDCAPGAPHASPLCRDLAEISERHCCAE